MADAKPKREHDPIVDVAQRVPLKRQKGDTGNAVKEDLIDIDDEAGAQSAPFHVNLPVAPRHDQKAKVPIRASGLPPKNDSQDQQESFAFALRNEDEQLAFGDTHGGTGQIAFGAPQQEGEHIKVDDDEDIELIGAYDNDLSLDIWQQLDAVLQNLKDYRQGTLDIASKDEIDLKTNAFFDNLHDVPSKDLTIVEKLQEVTAQWQDLEPVEKFRVFSILYLSPTRERAWLHEWLNYVTSDLEFAVLVNTLLDKADATTTKVLLIERRNLYLHHRMYRRLKTQYRTALVGVEIYDDDIFLALKLTQQSNYLLGLDRIIKYTQSVNKAHLGTAIYHDLLSNFVSLEGQSPDAHLLVTWIESNKVANNVVGSSYLVNQLGDYVQNDVSLPAVIKGHIRKDVASQDLIEVDNNDANSERTASAFRVSLILEAQQQLQNWVARGLNVTLGPDITPTSEDVEFDETFIGKLSDDDKARLRATLLVFVTSAHDDLAAYLMAQSDVINYCKMMLREYATERAAFSDDHKILTGMAVKTLEQILDIRNQVHNTYANNQACAMLWVLQLSAAMRHHLDRLSFNPDIDFDSNDATKAEDDPLDEFIQVTKDNVTQKILQPVTLGVSIDAVHTVVGSVRYIYEDIKKRHNALAGQIGDNEVLDRIVNELNWCLRYLPYACYYYILSFSALSVSSFISSVRHKQDADVIDFLCDASIAHMASAEKSLSEGMATVCENAVDPNEVLNASGAFFAVDVSNDTRTDPVPVFMFLSTVLRVALSLSTRARATMDKWKSKTKILNELVASLQSLTDAQTNERITEALDYRLEIGGAQRPPVMTAHTNSVLRRRFAQGALIANRAYARTYHNLAAILITRVVRAKRVESTNNTAVNNKVFGIASQTLAELYRHYDRGKPHQTDITQLDAYRRIKDHEDRVQHDIDQQPSHYYTSDATLQSPQKYYEQLDTGRFFIPSFGDIADQQLPPPPPGQPFQPVPGATRPPIVNVVPLPWIHSMRTQN